MIELCRAHIHMATYQGPIVIDPLVPMNSCEGFLPYMGMAAIFSCDHIVMFTMSHLMEAPYETRLQLALWLGRKICLIILVAVQNERSGLKVNLDLRKLSHIKCYTP